MGKIVITGTPGSGKTTIISLLKGIKIVNLADEMLKLMSAQNLNHDKIRYVSDYNQIAALRGQILKDLSSATENMMIDTHTSVKRGTKYIPGFSTTDLDILKKDIKAILYLDAEAGDIMLRRIKDKTRDRESETVADIKEQRSVNISLASFYSSYLNTPLFIIKNKQNEVNSAKDEVERAINETFGTGSR